MSDTLPPASAVSPTSTIPAPTVHGDPMAELQETNTLMLDGIDADILLLIEMRCNLAAAITYAEAIQAADPLTLLEYVSSLNEINKARELASNTLEQLNKTTEQIKVATAEILKGALGAHSIPRSH